MRALLLSTLVALGSSCAVVHDELSPPSIQRPTISSNTRTTAPGQIDLEGGILAGDEWEAPSALRWGSGRNVETFLELDLWRRRMGEGGIGDLAIGMRHRVSEDPDTHSAFAYQLRTTLPTANESKGLGSGATDFDAAFIFDWQFRGNPVTTYYELAALGTSDSSGVDAQHTLAIAVDVPLEGRWDFSWEAAGLYSSGASISEVDLTLAGHYTVSPLAVVDMGVRIGMGGSARDTLFFVGIGRAFARLVAFDPPR